jgi:hypothetical protein
MGKGDYILGHIWIPSDSWEIGIFSWEKDFRAGWTFEPGIFMGLMEVVLARWAMVWDHEKMRAVLIRSMIWLSLRR